MNRPPWYMRLRLINTNTRQPSPGTSPASPEPLGRCQILHGTGSLSGGTAIMWIRPCIGQSERNCPQRPLLSLRVNKNKKERMP